ncbi:MAG: S1 RNA-binding domain-containing protein [Chitinispirillales bacterium]|jgi:uncharacterized protein|nr:S1 RNA-binding domain-containing protein [Chitinispirillales bacterium]
MHIFARYIEDRWHIPFDAALSLCSHHERGYSIYFMSEYVPNVSICGIETVCEIYKFLDLQKKLESLKTQARKILKSAEKYNDGMEDNISLSISKTEIDDIVASFKINSQSKGRTAIVNGLLPLANLFYDNYCGDIEKEAEKYLSSEKNLNTIDDVIDGAAAILTDRFGFDENARISVRDLTAKDGNIEISVKKKTAKYDKFIGIHNLSDINDDDILFLMDAEKNKNIKFSVIAPFLSILELLRHNFLTCENSSAEPIINRAISDACNKFLVPMAQNSIKEEIFEGAVERVSRTVSSQLYNVLKQRNKGTKKNILIISQNLQELINIIVVDNEGTLLRASAESVRQYGKPFSSGKIRSAFEQWSADEFILVEDDKCGEFMNSVVETTITALASKPKITRISSNKKISEILKTDFVKSQVKNFDKTIQNVYAYGICAIAPLALISEPECLSVLLGNHAVQYLPKEEIKEITDRNLLLLQLKQGIEIGSKKDRLLLNLGISQETLEIMRTKKTDGILKSKKSIADIDGMNEAAFNNVSGFVIFPNAGNLYDKSLIHPQMYHIVDAVCNILKCSLENIIGNKNIINGYKDENPVNEFFIKRKIANQLKIAARYLPVSVKHRKRVAWSDIIPGTFTQGTVRNVTDFGIFVDINAFTDGLVHISEIPEYLSETFKPGAKIRVKILDVDDKKRRIALSLKHPKTEIPDLTEFFNEDL